ncbi:MAG: mannose-1-phosphate guanylyltransferase [Balneolaceae bacterium]|nr:mannose-1-phosphate guanylyltransferase [Balneolaceae bacterium]MCH8548728.1 NTP transferase domain-containing protein [Balneolaceae bacterium]
MNAAVIMAGGSGTRFWPKSTKSYPKQFQRLFGEKTMLQETADRLEGFVDPDNIMVVTNKNYLPIVRNQLPDARDEFLIGEPVAKNTAPCVAAAAALLYREDPDSVMIVLPADHRIGRPDKFQEVLDCAVRTAKGKECLVTIGIEPAHPETGYGYIKYDQSAETVDYGMSSFRVDSFTEKPNLKKAKAFLESGNYLWNSGMFVWKSEVILKAFERYMPELYQLTQTLIRSNGSAEDINRFYKACPSVSIDYGIMEKAEEVEVLPGRFDWSDVGSWTAVHELSEKDSDGNVTGDVPVSMKGSTGNLVQSESGKLVALVGVDNLAVVETENAILVVNLEKAQDVKKVVEDLKSDPDKKKYL